jgi:hypothetical protein
MSARVSQDTHTPQSWKIPFMSNLNCTTLSRLCCVSHSYIKGSAVLWCKKRVTWWRWSPCHLLHVKVYWSFLIFCPNLIIFMCRCAVRSLLPLTFQFTFSLWLCAPCYLALHFHVLAIASSSSHIGMAGRSLYFLNEPMHKLFLHCLPIAASRSQVDNEKDGKRFIIHQCSKCSRTCHYASCVYRHHNSTDWFLLSGYYLQ